MDEIEPLLLDACGLINLCATGRVDEIAAFFGGLSVVEDVADEAPSAIAVTAAIQVLSLSDDEAAALVALAAVDGMDAGEAATFAVAALRNLAVVTDDRRATRAAAEEIPRVPIYRTATVVRAFVEGTSLAFPVAALLLQAIEEDASFAPAPGTPDATWWREVRSAS